LEALDDEEPAGLVPEEVDELRSRVPAISTLWPTCGLSLLSSPSSRYIEPAAEAPGAAVLLELELLDPDVPVALIAFARINDPPPELDELEPAVPVAPGVADVVDALRWIHPWKLTLSAFAEVDVDVGGAPGSGRCAVGSGRELDPGGGACDVADCAATSAAQARQANVVVSNLFLMSPPLNQKPGEEVQRQRHRWLCSCDFPTSRSGESFPACSSTYRYVQDPGAPSGGDKSTMTFEGQR
jgi:hypothetical protein